jgi:hypothetical protein
VEQDNWRAVAAVAHIDRCVFDVDLIGREALEHAPILPARSLHTGPLAVFRSRANAG